MPNLSRSSRLLLLTVVIAVLCATPPAPAQTSPAPPAAEASAAPAEPYLDRKVGSGVEKFSHWKARMKKEHFTAYLITYTAILATIAGLLFGFSAYRLADPMSPYRLMKRRTLQLSLAIGGTLGIFTAVMQVPQNTAGKVSLLVLATATGTVITLLCTWFTFLAMRLRTNRHALRDRRRTTDRMRHA